MSDWMIDGIAVPEDLQWIDEAWTGSRQAEELALAGGLILQRSRQTSGRPITLQTPIDHPVRRELCEALQALDHNPNTGAFTVVGPDATQYLCRFRKKDAPDGRSVDWAPLAHVSPPDPTDLCNLTLRLMIV